MKLLHQAHERSGLVRFAASDHIAWRPALFDAVPRDGNLTIAGVGMAAPVARKMAKVTKTAARKASDERRVALKNNSAPPKAVNGWITTVELEPSRRLEPPMRLGARV